MSAPFSKKLTSGMLAQVLVAGFGYLALHAGAHVSPGDAATFALGAGVLANLGAGWLAREDPRLFGGDVPTPPTPLVVPPVVVTVPIHAATPVTTLEHLPAD